MGNVTIVPLSLTKKDITAFVKCGNDFYRGNPYYVAPFTGDKVKFIIEGSYREVGEIMPFMAYRDGVVVGRIIAHFDRRHNEHFSVKRGCFGFFECVNDREVSRALLDAAEKWLRERGMESMEGPYSFMLYDAPGILMDDFDNIPAVELGYNPPYYADLVLDYGMEKTVDWYAYLFKAEQEFPRLFYKFWEKVKKDAETHKDGLVIRDAEMKRFDEERNSIMKVFNEAWGDNWGHYPLTQRQWDNFTMELKTVIKTELVLVAEYDGEMVGFIVSIPDVNQALIRAHGKLFPFGILKVLLGLRKITRLKTVIMGVLPKYRMRGLDAYFVVETIERGKKLGYKEADMSLVVENNMAMRNAIEHLGGVIYKTYRIFKKDF